MMTTLSEDDQKEPRVQESVLVAEGLVTWPSDQPALIGAHCATCKTVSFPMGTGCPRCGGEQLEEQILPREGTLWTWTTQDFLPKEPYLGASHPDDFEPWCVGLIEFAGILRVEGRLAECDSTTLRIGQRVRTVVVPFTTNAEGQEVLTFAFAPVAEQALDEELAR